MASITSFSAIARLAVTPPAPDASGLCSDIGSQSGVGVQGDGLGGMQIKVTRNDGKGPKWMGTLSNSVNDKNELVANLDCLALGSDVDTRKNLGDPEDVPVTVACGTDLARLPPAATLSVTVQVGPAPT
jgi:hypothetical protein